MRKKVLIVEDNFIEANNMRMLLDSAGYTVCDIALSVEQALKILGREFPDLVLLDIFLKGRETGIELGMILKQRKIPFVYLSANSDKRTFEQAKKTQPYGFLIKPFREKDVLTTLDIAVNLHKEHLALEKLSRTSKPPMELTGIPEDDLGFVGESSALKEILKLIHTAANASSPVLILGESGTGKEGVARAIHQNSVRKNAKMVIVDCAAMSASLIESELFGYEKGSFTGASEKRIGNLEQADRGTIFLDEIGEMPLEIQSKLLRVIQEKEICPIGGKRKKIDVRFIAATNRNLEEEVATGRFRLDLYYRLFVFPIYLPALRNRREDILPIAEHYLKEFGLVNNKTFSGFSPQVKNALTDHPWPGNVRQLINLIERSVLLSNGGQINDLILQPAAAAPPSSIAGVKTMAENERDHIVQALEHCNGKLYGQGGAAELLEINASTLRSRMAKLGIKKQFS